MYTLVYTLLYNVLYTVLYNVIHTILYNVLSQLLESYKAMFSITLPNWVLKGTHCQ